MSAVTEINESVSRSPLSGEAERIYPFAEWNETGADYPGESCIHDLFEAQVERTPEKLAIVFEENSLTYRELNSRANRLARRLRARGVGPGSLAGVFVDRSADMVVALLGILKAGGAYVPLDPSYPKDRLSFMIEDARIETIVSERRLAGEMPSNASLIICVDEDFESRTEDDESLDRAASAEDLAYVIYTSGSTGRPKGVQIPHRAVVNFLTSMQREPGLTESDILLSVTTISFDIAALEIFLPLISGAKVVIVSREAAADGARLSEEIARSRATVLQATPATWRLLLGSGWRGDRQLRMLCGGEALPRDLAAQLLERGACLWNMYGPTETTIWSSVYRVRPEDERILIGRPIANTQIYLLDENLQPVPVGEAGELYIGGDGLARGYLNRPELTAEKFIPSPFDGEPSSRIYRTGDLARYMPDGNIECLGRIDHQVKIRGHRIELGEIEAALREHASVRESVVAAREDEAGDKRLVAYVVVERELPASPGVTMASELRSHLGARLPDYMLPSAFVALDALPLTPNGKIDRNALPALDFARTETARPIVAPRDPLEHQLAEIWEEVLNVRPVGVSDNFFELGGHSLLAAQMMNEVEQAFGRRLALDTLYRDATIESLASLLLERGGDELQSPIVQVQAGGGRHPFFFLHGDHSGGGFYCLNLARRLDREQPFYVIPPHGTDGGEIPPTIEAMAACRLRTLRQFQPRGPYFLGGFCNGALVAYEMARQLEQMGERIGLLAMVYVSATNTRMGIIQTMIRGIDSMLGIGADRQLDHFLSVRSRMSDAKRILGDSIARLGKARGRRPAIERGSKEDSNGEAQIENAASDRDGSRGFQRVIRWDITAKYNKIMDGYVPRRYGGRVSLFWPDQAEPEGEGDPSMGWCKVAAGGVDLYSIAGRHLTCITRHVEVLAGQMNACLRRAQGIDGK